LATLVRHSQAQKCLQINYWKWILITQYTIGNVIPMVIV